MKPGEFYMSVFTTLSVELNYGEVILNRTHSSRQGRDAQKSSQSDLETEKSVKWNDKFRIMGKSRVPMETFHHFSEMNFPY